jgi:hypothetical protein
MIRVLRAITGGKVSDTKDEGGEVAEIYPIAIAIADGIVTELYKVIEALRADLHYRRHRGAGGYAKSARQDTLTIP